MALISKRARINTGQICKHLENSKVKTESKIRSDFPHSLVIGQRTIAIFKELNLRSINDWVVGEIVWLGLGLLTEYCPCTDITKQKAWWDLHGEIFVEKSQAIGMESSFVHATVGLLQSVRHAGYTRPCFVSTLIHLRCFQIFFFRSNTPCSYTQKNRRRHPHVIFGLDFIIVFLRSWNQMIST